VASDGSMTLTQGGQALKGQLVWLGDGHFQILITAERGTPPQVTADLSADGKTMTVHSSDSPGPIVYKKIS
jgi:hypothetical protein